MTPVFTQKSAMDVIGIQVENMALAFIVFAYLSSGSKIKLSSYDYNLEHSDSSKEDAEASAHENAKMWVGKIKKLQFDEQYRQNLIACSLQVLAEKGKNDITSGMSRLEKLLSKMP